MAAQDENTDYLAPEFDPSSLTMPKLRGLLVEYNVPYPSSAKKAQLVDLFKTGVAPQAEKTLKARKTTKRSAKGIADVESSGSASTSAIDRDDAPSGSDLLKRNSSRRQTRLADRDDRKDVQPSAKSVPWDTITISRATETDNTAPLKTTQHARIRPRKSVSEEAEPSTWRQYGSGSPFSNDNPFQSGSSPPADGSGERHRKYSHRVDDKERRKSSRPSRRTDQGEAEEQDGSLLVPHRSASRYEVNGLRTGDKKEERSSPEYGEEFTPEEQMDLVRSNAKEGKQLVVPRRRNKQRSAGTLTLPVLAICSVLLALFSGAWREEKLKLGYCGVGKPSGELAGLNIPDWASALQPECEPCPQHAFCFPKLHTECEPGFLLKPHPLSLGGLVPLPPTCEPDGEKAKKVKHVADRAVEELRQRNAEVECGTLQSDGKLLRRAEVSVPELKTKMATQRRKGITEAEFNDLWDRATQDVLGRDEITSSVNSQGHLTLRTTSLARVPLSCAIRRSIRATLVRNLQRLVIVLLLASGTFYGRHALITSRTEESRAKELASSALDRLATQAALNAEDPARFPESWISIPQLRDDVLRDEFDAARRRRLWDRVVRKVEGNSNVRAMSREGRSGDVSRVWEWIGSVSGLIEDAMPEWPSSSAGIERRRSGRKRLSWGGGGLSQSSPLAGVTVGKGEEMQERYGKGTTEHLSVVDKRRWDEGRPIY